MKTLLVANIVIWLLCNLSQRLLEGLCLSSLQVRNFELWRLGTYMFVHQGFGHLLMNMWGLWVFGELVENCLGKVRMYQLYVFSGFIGGLLWMLLNWNRPAICIGASGAVFGVMMAAAIAYPQAEMQLLIPPVKMRLRTLALCLAGLEIILEIGNSGLDSVAHLAHLGGMLGAFIYMRRLIQKYQGNAGGGLGEWLASWYRRLTRKTSSGGSGSKGSRLGDLDPQEVDRVLDKLATTGRSSLTPEEHEILDEASRRLRGDSAEN